MHTRIVKAVAFSLVLSLVDARRVDLGKRSGAAITRVTADSVAGAPWFEYEKHQLVQDSIALDSGPRLQAGECRTFPGDSSWPSESDWSDLNDLLNGALIQTVPVAAPCYKDWGVYNKEQCDVIRVNFSNPYFQRIQHRPCGQSGKGGPVSRPDDPDGICSLGGYPVYAVNVSTVGHIQAALTFARRKNLRFVIKNTGHCYLGKSNGAGALSVWMHNLKDIEFLPDYQSDGGSYRGTALKVGAGVTVREVYEAAHRYGVSALGGICESVGFAGGYVAGGGHTPLSGLYGMAADQALAFEVVTADGEFVTASETSNPDLYWALQGGGGSTYGVVTSVIVRTSLELTERSRVHPKIHSVMSTFDFNTSPTLSNETFFAGIQAYLEYFIPFTDAGTYSYFAIVFANGTYTFQMQPFFAPNHTLASFQRLAQPLFDQWAALGIDITPNTTAYDAFLPAYLDNWSMQTEVGASVVGGTNSLPSNRLFPRANFADPARFNATWAAIAQHMAGGHRIIGYHQAPRNRLGVDNGVSSAWRSVVAFLITGADIPAGATAAQLAQAGEEIDAMMGPWRDVAPAGEGGEDGGGSYLNEANVMEPDWQTSFYGEQYPRLLQIKQKWDPTGVFYATTGVGSEGWELRTEGEGLPTQNGRLCRV
ncbi:FAD/FMN-containing isoamyl alcohol oxidase-like protein MreA [Apiospora marii]|uniref:FAD/FMN-containing isoamyl alcohol oxidase-like protein MreA n=1 Tax=Apiospora marii TaxID=335849 RepID=A0ABR1R3T4_9PEZI